MSDRTADEAQQSDPTSEAPATDQPQAPAQQPGVFVAKIINEQTGEESYVPQIIGDVRYQEIEGVLKGGLQTFIKHRGY